MSKIRRGLVAIGLVVAMGALAAPAGATHGPPHVPANEAAELCRALDESGELDEFGVTRGECVNILKGPASENANNFIAALCGAEEVQEATGTTNKGQCIKVLRGTFFPTA